MKDIKASNKEIESQNKRIEAYKVDDTRDEYDVKKQEEVLAEYLNGRQGEFEALKKYTDELETHIVSALAPKNMAAYPGVAVALSPSPAAYAWQKQAEGDEQLGQTAEMDAATDAVKAAKEVLSSH